MEVINSKYIAEFIGTAIFLTIILKSGGDKWVIIAGLLAAILFMGDVSGGHFNPAVSFMQFTRGALSSTDLIGFVIAQILGAVVATRVATIQ